MSSDSSRANQQRAQMFEHLLSAGQWDRAIEIGNELLTADPEDAYVHQRMALAAIQTENIKLADHHSQAAVQFEPEETFSHLIRARFFEVKNRPLLAKKSFLEALRLDPEDAELWSAYGWNCYSRGDMQAAITACEAARQLNPHDADIQNLEAAARGGIEDETRYSAYEQIEVYEESLKLNPAAAETYYNIGVVYLTEFLDGKNAREWLREAVIQDPTNKMFQKALFKAVCMCHPVLKVLELPVVLIRRGFVWADNFKARKPWLILLLVPVLVPVGLLMMVVGVLWVVFLYVPSKLFRLVAYPELMSRATGQPTCYSGFYRTPFWLRVAGFTFVTVGLVWGVWAVLTSKNFKLHSDMLVGGGMLIGMIVGIVICARKKKY